MSDYKFYDYSFNKSTLLQNVLSEFYYLNTYYNGSKEFYSYTFDAKITSHKPNPKGYNSELLIEFPYYSHLYGDPLKNSSVLGMSCEIYILIQDNNYNTIEERTVNHAAGSYDIAETFKIDHSQLDSVGFPYLRIKIKIKTPDGKEGTRETSFQVNEVPKVPQIYCDRTQGGLYVPIVFGETFEMRIKSTIAMNYMYKVSYTVTIDDGIIYTSDLEIYRPNTVSDLYVRTLTLPESLMDSITKSKIARVVFECSTYAMGKDSSGQPTTYTEYLGKSTCSFDAEISSRWKPGIIGQLIVTPIHIVDDVICNDGDFIEDVSKANIKITPKTYYSASIESYKIYYDWIPASYPNVNISNFTFDRAKLIASGRIENEEQQAALTSEGITTPVLIEKGYYVFYVVLTDSRGFTSTVIATTRYYEVIEKELISGTFDSFRCNSNGVYYEEGTYIRCICEATLKISSTSGLNCYVDLFSRNNNGDYEHVTREYVTATKNASTSEVIVGEIFSFSGVNPQLDYKTEFVIQFSDEVVKTSKLIPSSNSIIDIAPNGSIALGKKADDNVVVFDIAMNTRPGTDASYNLGDSNHRWTTIYAVNALNTSDRRFKENINYISEPEQHELYEFYKSKYLLTTYNYKGQDKEEYGFITQDMYDNKIGEMLIIKNDKGDMFSMNSYVSSIAGALQYEINLRDKQIEKLTSLILELQEQINNLK